MEHTDNQTQLNRWIKTNRETVNLVINVAFVLGIFIFCFLLVFVIIKLVKNVDEIRTDPIIYGMEKNNFNSCSCYEQDGFRRDYTIGVPDWTDNLNYQQVINGSG